MAFTAVNKSSTLFAPKLYTGTGAIQTISGVGFQPDMTWIKGRSNTEHPRVYDSVRGATKEIYTSQNWAEATNANTLSAFNSDGFVLGTDGGVSDSSNFVSWNWKAGTTSGLSGGDITPSAYSYNATSGFGIYKYTGTGSQGDIPHGLGATPTFVWVKKTNASVDHTIYQHDMTAAKYSILNSTDGFNAHDGPFGGSAHAATDTTFTVGDSTNTNASGDTYIAYVFAPKAGFSAGGIYDGNSNIQGPFIFTGFRPKWVLIHRYGANGNAWEIFDDQRSSSGGHNEVNFSLAIQDAANEDQSSDYDDVDFCCNGVKIREDNDDINGGSSYIWLAFGQTMVGTNGVPGTAR